jgi:hypothetical protein
MRLAQQPSIMKNPFMKSSLFAIDQDHRLISLNYKRGFSNTPLIIEKQSKHVEKFIRSSHERHERKNKSFEAPMKHSKDQKVKRLNTSLTSEINNNLDGDRNEERELFSKYIKKLDTREMDYKRSKRNLSVLIKAERGESSLEKPEKENVTRIKTTRALSGNPSRSLWKNQNKDPEIMLDELLGREKKRLADKLLEVHEKEDFMKNLELSMNEKGTTV